MGAMQAQDFSMCRWAVKKLFHARRHHIGLRQVAHGADEAHAGRFGRVFLGCEQVFAEALGGRRYRGTQQGRHHPLTLEPFHLATGH